MGVVLGGRGHVTISFIVFYLPTMKYILEPMQLELNNRN